MYIQGLHWPAAGDNLVAAAGRPAVGDNFVAAVGRPAVAELGKRQRNLLQK